MKMRYVILSVFMVVSALLMNACVGNSTNSNNQLSTMDSSAKTQLSTNLSNENTESSQFMWLVDNESSILAIHDMSWHRVNAY